MTQTKRPNTTWIGGVEPKVGDTARASEIDAGGKGMFHWVACPNCGRERWVPCKKDAPLCLACSARKRGLVGAKNPRWNGGVRRSLGYNYVTVPEDHPLIGMAGKVFVHGKRRYYIAEHRLVAAQQLGRSLEKWEVVHHINGVKDDNRPENLELVEHRRDHLGYIALQRRIATLEGRVTLLEAENALLKSQLPDGRDSVPDIPELRRYNTPGSCEPTEGIVHPSSNGGNGRLIT